MSTVTLLEKPEEEVKVLRVLKKPWYLQFQKPLEYSEFSKEVGKEIDDPNLKDLLRRLGRLCKRVGGEIYWLKREKTYLFSCWLGRPRRLSFDIGLHKGGSMLVQVDSNSSVLPFPEYFSIVLEKLDKHNVVELDVLVYEKEKYPRKYEVKIKALDTLDLQHLTW